MTTRVLVVAGHGWPVDVTRKYKNGKEDVIRVPANTVGDLVVYDGLDLLIHEVQPNEMEEEEK